MTDRSISVHCEGTAKTGTIVATGYNVSAAELLLDNADRSLIVTARREYAHKQILDKIAELDQPPIMHIVRAESTDDGNGNIVHPSQLADLEERAAKYGQPTIQHVELPKLPE